MKKSMILKLDTEEEGLLEGQEACAGYLEKKVKELLDQPASLDVHSQDELLNEVTEVITNEDNAMLEKMPTKEEVEATLSSSNLSAAAGSDGIPGLLYKECWTALGDSFVEVIRELFSSHI